MSNNQKIGFFVSPKNAR